MTWHAVYYCKGLGRVLTVYWTLSYYMSCLSIQALSEKKGCGFARPTLSSALKAPSGIAGSGSLFLTPRILILIQKELNEPHVRLV